MDTKIKTGKVRIAFTYIDTNIHNGMNMLCHRIDKHKNIGYQLYYFHLKKYVTTELGAIQSIRKLNGILFGERIKINSTVYSNQHNYYSVRSFIESCTAPVVYLW